MENAEYFVCCQSCLVGMGAFLLKPFKGEKFCGRGSILLLSFNDVLLFLCASLV